MSNEREVFFIGQIIYYLKKEIQRDFKEILQKNQSVCVCKNQNVCSCEIQNFGALFGVFCKCENQVSSIKKPPFQTLVKQRFSNI